MVKYLVLGLPPSHCFVHDRHVHWGSLSTRITFVKTQKYSVLHVYLSKSSQPTLRDIVEKRKNTPKEKMTVWTSIGKNIDRMDIYMTVWTFIGKNIMTIWTSHSELEFI